MTPSAIAMSVLLGVFLTSFAIIIKPRILLLLHAQADNRFDNYAIRALQTLKFAIGQWRMPRDPVAGFAHIFIFSGFMVVSVATVTHIMHGFIPGWQPPGLGGALGNYYMLIKDFFEALVLLGCAYGLYRRLSPSPTRVHRSGEAVFVLAMIVTLMLTDYLTYGGEIIATGSGGLPWNPGGYVASKILAPMGTETAILAGHISFWIHCFVVLLFLNFLPLGKHFHVITGIPNVFFLNLEPFGKLPKVDMEQAMEDEKFGINTSADLSWKMVMDLYSCTECGRCTVYCPTDLTGKPLSHRQLNLDIKKALYADQQALLSGDQSKIDALETMVGGVIKDETIWSCTTCGSCEIECPVFIENVPRIIQMRQHKVTMEADFPVELQKAFEGMERNSNPWGIGADKRADWANGMDIPVISDLTGASKENPPMLFWIGCAGSFDDRSKKVTLAMVKILQAAQVPFCILGKEEGCTGDTARRAGNEYLFQMMAEANVEILNNYGVKQILTTCPHCLHTIGKEYPEFGGDYEVVHHTQFIEKLLEDGKLDLNKTSNDNSQQEIALHDSCYLGRYNDIYDAPRNVINKVPGLQLVEMPRNKSRSVCCGAGGGRFWMEEEISEGGERINVHRAKEAIATGAQTVGSSCPFCLTMLKDGVADSGNESVATQDIAELVAAALLTDTNSVQSGPSQGTMTTN